MSFTFIAGLALGFLLGWLTYKEVVVGTPHYIDDLHKDEGDEEI